MRALPDEMRASVFANPGSFSMYHAVKDAVTSLCIDRRMFSSNFENQYSPMEIVAVMGACRICEKQGHHADKCWSKGDGKGKETATGKGTGGKPGGKQPRNHEHDSGKTSKPCKIFGKTGHVAEKCWNRDKGKDKGQKGAKGDNKINAVEQNRGQPADAAARATPQRQ